MEANGKDRVCSTNHRSSACGYGPMLLSGAYGALTSHPQPLHGVCEGSEGVLGQKRAGPVS